MKISSIGVNKVYTNDHKIKETKKVNTNSIASDVIQISSIGKSLSSFSVDNTYSLSESQLEKLRNEVSNGTYNKDSKLVAEKIYDVIKGRSL